MNNSNLSYESSSSNVQILEEEDDEFYEPTDDEIIEYAEYLGMDIEEDSDLLWIAREGLKCKLPNDWKACKTTVGDIFYYNFETQESQWEHPRDEEWKILYAKEQENKLKKIKGNDGGRSINNNNNQNNSNNKQKPPTNDRGSKSKLQPLNKDNKNNVNSVQSLNSMENMDLDSNSKSNSLKRLDMHEESNQGSRNSNLSEASNTGSVSKTGSKSDLIENNSSKDINRMAADGHGDNYVKD